MPQYFEILYSCYGICAENDVMLDWSFTIHKNWRECAVVRPHIIFMSKI